MATKDRNSILAILMLVLGILSISTMIICIWIAGIAGEVKDLAESRSAYAEKFARLESQDLKNIDDINDLKNTACTINNRLLQVLVKLGINPVPETRSTLMMKKD